MSQNTVRIKLRQGSSAEWASAQLLSPPKGNLASGEIGLIIDEDTDGSNFKLIGHMGINSTPTPIDDCPIIFMSELIQDEFDPSVLIPTKPVIVPQQNIPQNSLITWDEEDQRWVTGNLAIALDSYPSQSGSVYYDNQTSSFQIGELITVSEIDCGTYGGTDV